MFAIYNATRTQWFKSIEDVNQGRTRRMPDGTRVEMAPDLQPFFAGFDDRRQIETHADAIESIAGLSTMIPDRLVLVQVIG